MGRVDFSLVVISIAVVGLGVLVFTSTSFDSEVLSIEQGKISRITQISEYSPTGATASLWHAEVAMEGGLIVEATTPYLPKSGILVCVVESLDDMGRRSYAIVGQVRAMEEAGQVCDSKNARFH